MVTTATDLMVTKFSKMSKGQNVCLIKNRENKVDKFFFKKKKIASRKLEF